MKRATWLGLGIVLGAGSGAGAQIVDLAARAEGVMKVSWMSLCTRPRISPSAVMSAWQAQFEKEGLRRYAKCVVDRASADAPLAEKAVYAAATEELEEVRAQARRAGWRFD